MFHFARSDYNPIIHPDVAHPWEAKGVFNASVIKDQNIFHLVYRALSTSQNYEGKQLELSTVGYATSSDGVNFLSRRQLIRPTEEWEKYGCEDPRITKIDNEYFVFYTALSDYPFHAGVIKVAVSIFSDFTDVQEKHLITPFNAKAMTLFPQKIKGKYAAIISVNTDIPPARVGLALFTTKEEMWSQDYWRDWYQHLDQHVLPFQRMTSDQIEVGATPLLTEYGWLVIYAHIQHYYNQDHRFFGIEAVLLDRDDPSKIIGRIEQPLLRPMEKYEKEGNVSNVVFPTGAYIEDNVLSLYYGAADTSCCLAQCSLIELFSQMRKTAVVPLKVTKPFSHPLLEPRKEHDWEAKAVFNPAAVLIDNEIHLVYRAMSHDNTSVFGYAKSTDGINFTQRSEMPVYVPRAEFETKKQFNGNSGCEDPRITPIGDKLYMSYTAYDGVNPPRVALTSIATEDFVKQKFSWEDPVLISPPGIDDKDAAIFPERLNDQYLIHNQYVIIHRIQNAIVLDFVDDLHFDGKTWLRSISYITPRGDSWDSEKIGVCTPPIKTEKGWILLYHGVSKLSHEYRVGAMLLDLNNPSNVLSRTPWPILEPELHFEREGMVSNVVFPCGAIVKDDTLFIYYGGADSVIGVATVPLKHLMEYLHQIRHPHFFEE